MPTPSRKLYMSDLTQDNKVSPEYGDSQVLVAGEKDKKIDLPDDHNGNQKKDYYQDY